MNDLYSWKRRSSQLPTGRHNTPGWPQKISDFNVAAFYGSHCVPQRWSHGTGAAIQRGDTIKPTAFCFSKTKTNTNHPPKPPETVTWEGVCKAGSSVASSSYGPLHPLPVLSCLYTQWSYSQPSTRGSIGRSSGHGLCWGSWPAKHHAQPIADPALAAQESAGSGPPGKLNTLQPVVDLAIDKMIQNLARSKESIIGYSC